MGVKLGLSQRQEHGLKVFENRLLRRILGPTKDEVTGGWGKLHSKEIHKLHFSANIVRAIKSRRMRWRAI
jgi:hypothetical protein